MMIFHAIVIAEIVGLYRLNEISKMSHMIMFLVIIDLLIGMLFTTGVIQ